MRAVITRVKNASVTIDGNVVGRIGHGFLILLGVATGDTEAEAKKLADKVCGLRVFEDENGKMNLSVRDTGGEAIVVSQFTLYADCRKGNRPSFVNAAPPELASPLVDRFIELLTEQGVPSQSGRFGAYMQVELLNDGPVTIILEM